MMIDKELHYLDVFGGTCIGLKRKNNQDSVLILKQRSLFAVADGMGGGYDGGKASKMCLAILEEHVRQAKLTPGTQECALIRAIYEASGSIGAYPRPQRYSFMGTTLACILFNPWVPGTAMVAHAGDSRVYLMRRNVLNALTIDHIVANETAKKAIVTNRGALTNYVGKEKDFYLERVYTDVCEGDCFLICSDGLHKAVPLAEMSGICQRGAAEGTETICRQLIEQALLHGGNDNISVIVIKVNQLPASYEPTEEEQEVESEERLQCLQILGGSSGTRPDRGSGCQS